MAKRRRSAKQRANDKRLGAMARARGRSAPKRRRRSSTRKTIKRRSPVRTMARRRRAPARRSSSRGFASKIPLINNPTVRKAAVGIGMATIAVTALNLVAPSIAQNPIVKPAVALLTGGVPGAAAQLLLGGGASISNILGGGGQPSGGGFQPGFA